MQIYCRARIGLNFARILRPSLSTGEAKLKKKTRKKVKQKKVGMSENITWSKGIMVLG